MVVKIDYCEECGEPIRRSGTQLWCENGCYDDDTRNFFSEDALEAGQTGEVIFPPDEQADEAPLPKRKATPCDSCGGEDCPCCEYYHGY